MAVQAAIKFLDLTANRRLHLLETSDNRTPVQVSEGRLDRHVSHGIDIAADRRATELKRFAYSSAASHERIKNNQAWKTDGLIEKLQEVRAAWGRGGKQDGPKDGPETLRPPLVDVIYRPVNLFPPTLDLCYIANRFEGKTIFDDSVTAFGDK